jgi:hypothetical protein
MEEHRSYQMDLYRALNECGRGQLLTIARAYNWNVRDTTVQFSFNITHESLDLNWKFVSLPREFFRDMSQPDGGGAMRGMVWNFRRLFQSIVQTQNMGLESVPRDPIYRRTNDPQRDGFFSMKTILHYDVEDI